MPICDARKEALHRCSPVWGFLVGMAVPKREASRSLIDGWFGQAVVHLMDLEGLLGFGLVQAGLTPVLICFCSLR